MAPLEVRVRRADKADKRAFVSVSPELDTPDNFDDEVLVTHAVYAHMETDALDSQQTQTAHAKKAELDLAKAAALSKKETNG